jgi:hypothetical protein
MEMKAIFAARAMFLMVGNFPMKTFLFQLKKGIKLTFGV